nr:glutamate ABC transporter substrate-binding protein [Amycolatopsis sp. CA-230715]
MQMRSRTRRLLAAATAAVAAATSLAACGNPQTAGPAAHQMALQPDLIDQAPVASDEEVAQSSTAAAIKKRGQLIVGGDLNMPLLSQQNPTTGQTEGFDATLGKMLAKYIMGTPNTKITSLTPEIRETLLKINTVDVVIRIYTITEKRAEQVSFAGPYLTSGQAIATLKTTKNISKPSDLAGKKVCAVSNTTSAAAVQAQAPNAKLTTYNTGAECVSALEQGTADAYVHDLTVLAGAAQLNKKIQVVDSSFTNEPYGIGIKHGDTSFKKFINTWLKKIEDNGLWQAAWKKSLGTVVLGDAPAPPAIGSVPGS